MQCRDLQLHTQGKSSKRKRSPSAETKRAKLPSCEKALRPCGSSAEKAASSSGSSRSGCHIVDARGHYDVLGIPRKATHPEIKAAYRRLALSTHPDKGGRAEDFLKVACAWEILADTTAREEYDRDCRDQGCRDGLGVQRRTEPSPDVASVDTAKLGRSLARITLLELLSMQPEDWMAELECLHEEVLVFLSDYVLSLIHISEPTRPY